MTPMDYLMNAGFILLVLRQARERELTRRAFVVPLVVVFFVAQQYLHSIPTTGNDLVLIAGLTGLGLGLGTLCGFATHVRAAEGGVAVARVGWIAGILLIAGISSRMVFALAISHGFEPAVAGFSVAHQISAAAWPAALVLMAVSEVVARIVVVEVRGRLATGRGFGFGRSAAAAA